jgi:hypothetical protein
MPCLVNLPEQGTELEEDGALLDLALDHREGFVGAPVGHCRQGLLAQDAEVEFRPIHGFGRVRGRDCD